MTPHISAHLEALARHLTEGANFTVAQWQLYKGKGADDAAEALNKAVDATVADMEMTLKDFKGMLSMDRANKKLLNKAVYASYQKYLEPEMEKQKKFGATDSEPRYVAQQAVSDAARKILGSNVRFDDLW